MLRTFISPNLVFWLLPWVGALVMWWDERLDVNRRFLLVALSLCSAMAISVGFYFREHYFILLLPVLALLVAVGVSRSLQLLQRDQSLELFLALAVVIVAMIAVGAVLFGNGAIWLTATPKKAVETIYRSSIFGDARDVAALIAKDTEPDARIAVIGSEPEICFYARRRSATGYIYMYPLMEQHSYAAKMQKEMIQQIEAARPEYAVFVNNPLSWLTRSTSEKKLLDWWPQYWEQHYELVRTITTIETQAEGPNGGAPSGVAVPENHLLVLKRKR